MTRSSISVYSTSPLRSLATLFSSLFEPSMIGPSVVSTASPYAYPATRAIRLPARSPSEAADTSLPFRPTRINRFSRYGCE
jgi:hypothetical protein